MRLAEPKAILLETTIGCDNFTFVEDGEKVEKKYILNKF